MDTDDTRRTADRSRGLRRLRTLTIGTALFGAMATGTFGSLAALSTVAAETELTAAADAADVAASTTTTTTTSTAGSAPAVTTTTKKAHATSGGSK